MRLHFLIRAVAADDGEEDKAEGDESELRLHVHEVPPECCRMWLRFVKTALPPGVEKMQTDKAD